jgi:hypothetical protein
MDRRTLNVVNDTPPLPPETLAVDRAVQRWSRAVREARLLAALERLAGDLLHVRLASTPR